jgi:hypothetical protein
MGMRNAQCGMRNVEAQERRVTSGCCAIHCAGVMETAGFCGVWWWYAGC